MILECHDQAARITMTDSEARNRDRSPIRNIGYRCLGRRKNLIHIDLLVDVGSVRRPIDAQCFDATSKVEAAWRNLVR